MNLKQFLMRITTSVIFGVITNYILAGTIRVQCTIGEGGICPQPTWIEHAFDPVPIVLSMFIMVVVYSFWGIIQKK